MHYRYGDYLLDLVQNSIEAGARRIELDVHRDLGMLRTTVRDDGGGMDERTKRSALDPFYSDGKKHPGRRVGLGLPFVKQIAEATGGSFSLWSEPGSGTVVEFALPVEHPDTPPIGDVAGCFQALMSYAGDYELVINRSSAKVAYTLTRSELTEALGELESVGSQALLREYIESLEEGTQS